MKKRIREIPFEIKLVSRYVSGESFIKIPFKNLLDAEKFCKQHYKHFKSVFINGKKLF